MCDANSDDMMCKTHICNIHWEIIMRAVISCYTTAKTYILFIHYRFNILNAKEVLPFGTHHQNDVFCFILHNEEIFVHRIGSGSQCLFFLPCFSMIVFISITRYWLLIRLLPRLTCYANTNTDKQDQADLPMVNYIVCLSMVFLSITSYESPVWLMPKCLLFQHHHRLHEVKSIQDQAICPRQPIYVSCKSRIVFVSG